MKSRYLFVLISSVVMLSSCSSDDKLLDPSSESIGNSSDSKISSVSDTTTLTEPTTASKTALSVSEDTSSLATTTTTVVSETSTTAVSTTTVTTTTSPATTPPTTTTASIHFNSLNKTVYAVGYPALYFSASESSKIYRFIDPSSSVTVLAVSSDGVWYNVLFSGIKGYVKVSAFTEKQPQTSTSAKKQTSSKTSSKSATTSVTSQTQSNDLQSRIATDQTGIVNLTNQLRKSLGLGQLKVNAELSRAAAVRAKEIVQKFDHTRPNGSDCFTVVNGNFMMLGENIAMYGSTPKTIEKTDIASKLFDQWKNSSGHYANMVKPEYNCIGVGVYYETRSDGVLCAYGVQIFGKV